MWYYFVRSITVVSTPLELLALYRQLRQLVECQPFVSLCRGLVIQFSQKVRARVPGVWTAEVGTAFGRLLQRMAALGFEARSPAHNDVILEWCSVLEQVVNFQASTESLCVALEDLALLVDDNPLWMTCVRGGSLLAAQCGAKEGAADLSLS
jgi:hypothetical protein